MVVVERSPKSARRLALRCIRGLTPRPDSFYQGSRAMFLRAVSDTGGGGRCEIEWALGAPVSEPLPGNGRNPCALSPPTAAQGMHLAACTRWGRRNCLLGRGGHWSTGVARRAPRWVAANLCARGALGVTRAGGRRLRGRRGCGLVFWGRRGRRRRVLW